MKVAIYMSSRYKNYDKLSEILNNTLGALGSPIDEIMYNEKNDLIKKYADEHKIKTHAFSEEWDVYDKNAGPICVAQMIKPADKCIALWDGGSKGCRTFIKKCYEYGKTPITKKLNTSIQYPNSKETKAAETQKQADMEQKYLGGISPTSTQTPTATTTPIMPTSTPSPQEPVNTPPMDMPQQETNLDNVPTDVQTDNQTVQQPNITTPADVTGNQEQEQPPQVPQEQPTQVQPPQQQQ